MSKRNKPRHRKPQTGANSNTSSQGKPQVYASNARFIELGSPNVAFRNLVNIDHIVAVRFDVAYQYLNTEDKEVPAEQASKRIEAGWEVVVSLINQANSVKFAQEQSAMDYYNDINAQIAMMAPCTQQPPLVMPEVAEAANDVTDDAQLHDDDLGATADPANFILTDEEIDQLENPELGELPGESNASDPDEPATKPVYPH